MVTRKAVLVGIDSLSYGEFMKCRPKTLMYLLDNSFRGVVENKPPQDRKLSWLSILNMEEMNTKETSNEDSYDFPLVKLTNSALINIPISNPTYGEFKIVLDQKTSYQEEIDGVLNSIMENIEDKPVIAAITALERFNENICQIYNYIDQALLKIVRNVDEFIIFSPYGSPKKNYYEPYGVYLSSRPRPNEHETVKLWEIGPIFVNMVKGELGPEDF